MVSRFGRNTGDKQGVNPMVRHVSYVIAFEPAEVSNFVESVTGMGNPVNTGTEGGFGMVLLNGPFGSPDG